ncbi:2-keto-4-pentenoate hydratase [Micromonospora radicis]|uniref:2-keto-4-pentenoate hydratase n=1 Tax=Micromonospora radicis TaxID=1894971 RepID=UPI0011C48F92|nr:fumarylacetoacetate hydrolase family protein [Micromonospora radicis]
MTDDRIRAAAAALEAAERHARPVGRVSGPPWWIRPQDAYRVQFAQIEARTAAGARTVGYKVGLTSTGMQTLLGVDEPDFGHLLDDMRMPDGGVLDATELLWPRAEPELALVLAAPLGSTQVTAEEVRAATGTVHCALEIVDSRIENWDIAWPDTVADNGSGARFALGPGQPCPADVRPLTATLRKNGATVGSAPLSEVMGDPLHAVAWLSRTLFRLGVTLLPGQVVLSGSPCAATDITAGDEITAEIAGLAPVRLSVRP